MAQPRPNTRSARPAARPRARATTGRGGRPPKLTPDAIAQIEALIRAGATVDVAAQAAGVSRSSIYSWLAQGETARAGSPARDLRDRIERARAESETVLVARIGQAASKGSWQAAAWLLERRWPERWMKPTERPLSDVAAAAASDDDRELDQDPFADVVDLTKRRRH